MNAPDYQRASERVPSFLTSTLDQRETIAMASVSNPHLAALALPRTLDDFRQTGRFSTDLARDIPDVIANEGRDDWQDGDQGELIALRGPWPGMIYAGDLYVEQLLDGSWALTIGNWSEIDLSLDRMERELFERAYAPEYLTQGDD